MSELLRFSKQNQYFSIEFIYIPDVVQLILLEGEQDLAELDIEGVQCQLKITDEKGTKIKHLFYSKVENSQLYWFGVSPKQS